MNLSDSSVNSHYFTIEADPQNVEITTRQQNKQIEIMLKKGCAKTIKNTAFVAQLSFYFLAVYYLLSQGDLQSSALYFIAGATMGIIQGISDVVIREPESTIRDVFYKTFDL